MRSFVTFALLGVGLALAAPAAMAEDSAHEAREKLMKEVSGKNAKLGDQFAKGEIPFDAQAASAAMTAIAGVPDKFAKLLPEGTDSDSDPKSEASPKIWSDMAGFLAAGDKLKVASTAVAKAAEQGQEQFAAAFGDVFKACKGCHDAYRVKKD